MRRFTRLTNAFSKKIENHTAAVALHTMFYNFVRVHQTLKISPAMAAGVTDRLWDVSDIVQVLEDWEAQRVSEPSFDIEANQIGDGHFVRVMFPTGETEAVYGFALPVLTRSNGLDAKPLFGFGSVGKRLAYPLKNLWMGGFRVAYFYSDSRAQLACCDPHFRASCCSAPSPKCCGYNSSSPL